MVTRLFIFGSPNQDGEMRYHWQAFDENGHQVDGSGAARNGKPDAEVLKAEIQELYPDASFEA